MTAKKKPAKKRTVTVLDFDGRYGIATSRNTLLIYALSVPKRPGEPVEPGFVDTGTLVCAWHFADPKSIFVLIDALASIGTNHRQDEIYLAAGVETKPEVPLPSRGTR